ncbi:hypothetical protein CVT26_003580 [Gymnopilus dilepis]|uniref:Extracellular membrane protein CFEM domain-containing protein n=1 Tax=Gymnopilus dilepis TaxID=231916 RepID=A0A409VS86_9AGAR|nr:hypothetical protein CVT26_003580 [Gymnopilus dilepis]
MAQRCLRLRRYFVSLVGLWLIQLPSVQTSIHLLPRATIEDSIPSSCTQACQTIAESLDVGNAYIFISEFKSCEWGSCLCNEDDAQSLQSCMNCLYDVSPTQDIYNAAQGTFSVFEDMCNPALNVSLNISPASSSSSSTATSLSSTNSQSSSVSASSNPLTSTTTSPSTTTTTAQDTSSTSSSAPASPGVQGPDDRKQKCLLISHKKNSSRAKRSSFPW